MPKRQQTPNEELANSISHAVGILFSLVALPMLWYKASISADKPVLWSIVAYGLGMLLVFVNSTLYHSVKNQFLKAKLQLADHISIYFLIAGTYTPIVVLFLPNPTTFLLIIWALVVFGIIFKLFFNNRFKFVSVLFYLAMGWLVLAIVTPLKQNMPSNAITLMIVGGVLYSVGVVFYALSHKKGSCGKFIKFCYLACYILN